MTQNERRYKNEGKAIFQFLLEIAPKVIAIVTGVSFALSIIYDFGFFGALDLSFSDLPSTFSDHIRGVLDWLPTGILCAFATLILDRVSASQESKHERDTRTLKILPVREVILSPQDISAGVMPRLRQIGIKIFLWMIILGIPISYALSSSFSSYATSAPIVWGAFYFLFIWNKEREETSLGRLLGGVMLLLPMLAIVIWDVGRGEAINLSLKPAIESAVFENSTREEHITVLRYFDKGVLLKGSDDAISFLPWAGIRRIDTRVTYAPHRGLVCILTNWTPSCPRERRVFSTLSSTIRHSVEMPPSNDANTGARKEMKRSPFDGAGSGSLPQVEPPSSH